ncbi:hypothetical protein QZH56_08140 [Streptomyces olivoreticuli]|uniref:hypothetical protein n=1 Tax=Streptomyces olivoreticuli TaxID=68246 RepID=UPI00265AC626|nr:hypothetical protein [Streptomyces olivoreticuli]WKK25555.1 hypothetical protein QZH56_08140 [Streptomyces olivoreticuli]
MGKGKFDDATLEELYAMVAGGQPKQINDAADALLKAFTDINDLGGELQAHVERVKWEGEGGEAFRNWGAELAKQTLKLADYTLKVGINIGFAGQSLGEAKSSMPAVEPCYADAAKEKARLDGAESNRQEAIKAMERLDSYYRTVHTDVAGLEEPKFPRLPAGLVPVYQGYERPDGASASTGGAAASGGAGSNAFMPTADGVGAAARHEPSHPSGEGRYGSTGAVPGADRPAQTAIDAVALPQAPDNVTRHPVTHLPVDRPDPRGPVMPGPLVPAMPSGSQRGIEVPRTPAIGRPEQVSTPRPEGIPRAGGRDGIVGGMPARSGSQSAVPRLPRGTVVGEERTVNGPQAGTAAGPRGTAGAPGARTGGPMGMGGHPVGGGTSGPRNAYAGRRLATEPGGTAGGLRAPREGRSEFTQGGSGLVRSQPPGVMPHSGVNSSGSSRRRSSSRPDYLVEDEETWTRGRGNVVPPVID